MCHYLALCELVIITIRSELSNSVLITTYTLGLSGLLDDFLIKKLGKFIT